MRWRPSGRPKRTARLIHQWLSAGVQLRERFARFGLGCVVALTPEVGAGRGIAARPDLWRRCSAIGISTPTLMNNEDVAHHNIIL